VPRGHIKQFCSALAQKKHGIAYQAKPHRTSQKFLEVFLCHQIAETGVIDYKLEEKI
jgi:hypothetical protein